MSVKLHNISIGYSAPVVSAIDAELLSGAFVCLVGRNGTGKSTLLRTIAGLIKPLSGEISINSSVGIVITAFPHLQNTTVSEMVSYGRLPYQNILAHLTDDDIKAIDSAIDTVGISEFRNRKTCELSDGEKQKVMIARALAQGTDILLLDEPSAFLDYPSKVALMELLSDLSHKTGKAILLSTHDVELAKKYADCIWHINNHHLDIMESKDFSIETL